MCMQCMAGAMTAAAGASGTRAWLAAHRPRWTTPLRLRRITIALIAAAVLLSGGLFTGTHASGNGGQAADAAQPAAR